MNESVRSSQSQVSSADSSVNPKPEHVLHLLDSEIQGDSIGRNAEWLESLGNPRSDWRRALAPNGRT